ncbi:MAG: glycoside hydrolase family 2 protein, partial [Lewinella sp.]|nr:glycoside hydrolase family 2 protein [Lewinella sp.]
MANSSTFRQATILIAVLLTFSLLAEARDIVTLRTGWKFAKGHFDHAFQTGFNDAGWQDVSIPHDWAIAGPFDPNGDGNTGKLPWQGEGWYRLKLDIQPAYRGKRLYLIFDGVMAFPQVYVNGSLAGQWDYGYNSFYVEVTDLIRFDGDNVLAVHADTRNHDSRWYPGAGIYRKVQLLVTDPVHVAVWGTQATTPIVKPNYADVRIMTSVMNQSGADVKALKIEHIILSESGKKVAMGSVEGTLAAGKTADLEATLTLINPERWDIDHPVRYRIKTRIYSGDRITDEYETPFGVRTIRFTADHGFYLNDRRVQLKGVCLHHDHGPLGAAFYPRAMERQLEIMKSMGCNAVRTSHNAPAPELLELCDKMGILVLDELFDKYDRKADIADTTDFEEFARRNVRNFLQRDRNHPSIFLWSVGNEIGDVQYNINNGFQRLQTMVNYFRKYDPTRPVTLVCDNQNSAALRHFDYYDVHSWNYGRRYALARQLEPGKAVIISESASTLSTRGFYELPLPEDKTAFTKSLQVSSYDLNAPYWAEIPDDDFMWQQEEEYVAGEFVWTGFDYLGEPTPYTNDWARQNGLTDKAASRSSYFGIVDLCGIPKDRYYLYKSYWNEDEPTVHILPHWNWAGKEGEPVPVFVYTNGDCAELFLNGKSQGIQCKEPKSGNSTRRFRLMWDQVKYEPGELRAVAYREG